MFTLCCSERNFVSDRLPGFSIPLHSQPPIFVDSRVLVSPWVSTLWKQLVPFGTQKYPAPEGWFMGIDFVEMQNENLLGILLESLIPQLCYSWCFCQIHLSCFREPGYSRNEFIQYFYSGQIHKATVRPDFKVSLFTYFHLGGKIISNCSLYNCSCTPTPTAPWGQGSWMEDRQLSCLSDHPSPPGGSHSFPCSPAASAWRGLWAWFPLSVTHTD